MKFEKVSCDGCGRDLTTRTNIEDYRLVLASESKPGYGSGAYTCMGIYPAIERAHHFCGLGCLDHWRGREHHRDALRKAKSDAWAEQHGTKIDGRIRSYPCPPDDTLKAWSAECEAAALSAFPMKHSVTVGQS